jgi:drug/metabolite transporter (DMT)-like permease
MSKLPYLWMLLGSFFFAVMSNFAHAAGSRCDWQVVATARALLALLLAAAMVIGAGKDFVVVGPAVLWMRSIAGSVSLVCGFYALARMPVADVLTLTNMFPLWVAVLSWPMLRVVPRPNVWLAVACGLAGVALIQQPHFATGQHASLAALLASVTSAFAMIGLHRLRHIDARAIVVHFSGVSLLFCLAALFVFPHRAVTWSAFDGATLWIMLGMGACATAGQLLLTVAFAAGDPSRVSVVALCQVGFGMLFDRIFWGRTFSPATVCGILLIMIPTAWVILGGALRHTAAEEGE